MATPPRIKLLQPYKLWLMFNALAIVFLLIAAFGILRISKNENRKLVERQMETLIKSRILDLENGRYRDFVEGIGKEFTNLQVSIYNEGIVFQSGDLSSSNVCAQSHYESNRLSNTHQPIVKICRPYQTPFVPLTVLVVTYMLLSIVSVRFIRNLEESTLRTLLNFFKDSGVLVEDSDGLIGVLSKIKTIRTELDKAKTKELETVRSEELGKLATQVAHDMRGPLSSLKAASDQLENYPRTDPHLQNYLNLLTLSTSRLTTMANSLLLKYKGGQTEKTIFSLHHILDELVGEYQGQEQYRGIKFDKQYHTQAIELYGERAKLQRAFGNIIKNGVEAMKKIGAVTVRTTSENGLTAVSIKDTGPGISPEKLERVLAGGFTEGKKEGHGIGLTVVRETVAEFGGKLWAESNLGEGTSFYIQLPLPSPEILQKSPREETAMEKFTLQVFEKEPVIVIDDDPSLREQWRLVLVSQKREVILCESYEDFERQKLSPQISKTAIIDYHFENSEMNGADIVRALLEKNFTNLYLCTAEYWKPSIQKLAKELNVQLCPKPLPKISVKIKKAIVKETKEKGGYKVLVIDDDETIRLAWELMDRKLKIEKLYTFRDLESFQSQPVDLKLIDIAFVDKNIVGSQFSGAEVVKHLKANGVPKVILASGESQDSLQNDPQLAQADFIISEKIPDSFKEFFS